jgi:hypothetical protein
MDNPSQESQEELLASLFAIFPAFQAEWLADCEGEEWSSASLHSVYLSFLPYVSGANASPEQLKRLAALLNDAVSAGGDSENAVSTCFLEHVGQVGMLQALRPLLSREARSRLHA